MIKQCCFIIIIILTLTLSSCITDRNNKFYIRQSNSQDYNGLILKVAAYRNFENDPWYNDFKRGAEKFKKDHPGAEVEFIIGGEYGISESLKMAVASGSPWDLQYAFGSQTMPIGIINDLYQPIDNFIDINDMVFSKQTMELTEFNGRIYGMSSIGMQEINCIAYNETYFNNLGVKKPYDYSKEGKWNWDALIKTSKALSEKKAIIAMPNENSGISGRYLAKWVNGRADITYAGQKNKEWLNLLRNMIYVDENCVTNASLDNGKVAMELGTFSAQAAEYLKLNTKDSIRIINLPSKNSESEVYLNDVHFMIPKGSKKQNFAVQLAKDMIEARNRSFEAVCGLNTNDKDMWAGLQRKLGYVTRVPIKAEVAVPNGTFSIAADGIKVNLGGSSSFLNQTAFITGFRIGNSNEGDFYVNNISLFTPQVGSLAIVGSNNIIMPESGSLTRAYSAIIKDKFTFDELPYENAIWSVINAQNQQPSGITIDSNGLLTVNYASPETSITVKAVSKSDSSIFCTLAVTIEQLQIITIDINGHLKIKIPMNGEIQYSYSVYAKNQFDAIMSASKFKWNISGGSGARINEETGVLTVSSSASEDDITVWAVSEKDSSKKSFVTVSLSKTKSTTYRSGGGSSNSIPDTAFLPEESGNDDKAEILYSDIKNVPWAKEAILSLTSKEVVRGTSENTFSPNENVTRSQFVKMLIESLDLSAKASLENKTSNFRDVKGGQWYNKYILIAESLGLIKGYEDGQFGVDDPITRQDVAVLTLNFAEAAGMTFDSDNVTADFKDKEDIEPYSLNAIITMKNAGILNGRQDNYIEPNGLTTRAEAAVIIYRLLSR